MTATIYNIKDTCRLCDGYGYIQVDDGVRHRCQCIEEKMDKIKARIEEYDGEIHIIARACEDTYAF